MFKILLAILFIFSSAIAQAAMDGNALYDAYGAYARTTQNSAPQSAPNVNTGIYVGYVSGASDVFHNLELFCPPVNVKNKQLYDIVGQYLTEHPERRQNTAISLIWEALNEAFPCKQKKEGKP